MSLKKLKELTEQLVDRDFVLKKKQEILESLVDASPIPILIWIVDENLIFLENGNNGKIPSIGIDNPNEFIGMSVFDYFKTDDVTSEPIKYLMKVLQGETMNYWFEHNGAKLWNKCYPLRDYSGGIVGVVGITWDLSSYNEKHQERSKSSSGSKKLTED